MSPKDKFKLLHSYQKRTGIEIGKQTKIELEGSDESSNKDSITEDLTNATVEEKLAFKPQIVEDFITSFSDVSLDGDNADDDDTFQPMSFSRRVDREEENTEELYNDVKDRIINIDCSRGLTEAYEQFDSVLNRLALFGSGSLTNSQLIILVSSMITKLEELNKYNYPEITLDPVKIKLAKDGEKAVYNNSLNEYFFEAFYKYYQDIELEQFNAHSSQYKDTIAEFSEFQRKKSKMLMTLLKWLVS